MPQAVSFHARSPSSVCICSTVTDDFLDDISSLIRGASITTASAILGTEYKPQSHDKEISLSLTLSFAVSSPLKLPRSPQHTGKPLSGTRDSSGH